MKKTLFILLAFALVGSFVFAEDLTVEQRLDALEAAPALTITGSVSFGLGANFDKDGTNLPLATSSKAATAVVKLSTGDKKVTADLSMNLLAVPTVALAWDNLDSIMYGPISQGNGYNPEKQSFGAANEFSRLSAYIDFWNTYAETTTPNGDASIWATTDRAAIITQANSATSANPDIDTLVRTDADAADAPAITLKSLVQSSPTAGTEFILTDADTGVVPGMSGTMDPMVLAAIDKYYADASAAVVKAWTAGGTAGHYYDNIVSKLNSLTKVQIATLGSADRDVINAALAFAKAYDEVGTNPLDFGMSATVTQNFLTAASITLHGVGDVADVTMNFGAQHETFGPIALDESGHTDATVKAYPSVALNLASGVVKGLSAGAEFFFDDNAAKDAKGSLIVDLDDDVYTWLDESVAQVDPKLGYSVNAGYKIALSDDMSVGFNGAVGQYDFLNADDAVLGYSVGGSFSGMGATASAQMDYGLGMMDVNFNADYTVAGFTPYFAFDMYKLDTAGDYSIAYVATPTSVQASLKKDGGMVIGGGVKADLESYIGMPATLSGGAEYGMYKDTATDPVLAWNASVSVTPMKALVVSGGANADAILGTTLGWNAGAVYTLSDALAFSADISNAYNATAEDYIMTYNGGVTCTYGAAVIAGKVGTAYDATEGAATMQYSVVTTVKF